MQEVQAKNTIEIKLSLSSHDGSNDVEKSDWQ
jgi:hypothetical protein